MWSVGRHGGRGITAVKAWVVILTLRVKFTLSSAAGRFLVRRVARCLLSVGQLALSITKSWNKLIDTCPSFSLSSQHLALSQYDGTL